MQAFLRDYTRALRTGDAALFIGAGVSRAAGFVDWKQLLTEIADDLGLSVDQENDLVALAQFHVNQRGARDRINQLLIDEFLQEVELTESHRLLATLPVRTIWTTNYDSLLEDALGNLGRRVDIKRRQDDFATAPARVDATLYKMHGDKTLPSEAVLTKEDYEAYEESRGLFTIALKGDLARKTFLFLGFSFSDPNITYVLGRVRQLLKKQSKQHFCILRRPREDEDGAYACRRFEHWLKDLNRYNIQPVLIDDYAEVTEILAALNRRSHLRDVFISGSAADFEPLGEAKFQELCRLLGQQLIRKGYNIVSGYGVGVGDAVIVGAMQALQRNDDERLQLWPFPQQVPPGMDRAQLWREYRERMLAGAGVCIVLAGNKNDNGVIVEANGVRQEVEIALAQGKAILPVGATGHVAGTLWRECQSNAEKFVGPADVSRQLALLGDENADVPALVQAVLDALKQLEK